MSDTQQASDERSLLEARAKQLNIKFHPNTGTDKLRKKVNSVLGTPSQEAKKYSYLSHDEFLTERSKQIKKDLNRQIRIRISCNNPNKKNDETVLISVGSAKYGTYKEVIPLDWEAGWHVSKMVYDALKDKKYTKFYSVKGARGEKIRKGKLMPEYTIEVLDPLTSKELKDLAHQQAILNAE